MASGRRCGSSPDCNAPISALIRARLLLFPQNQLGPVFGFRLHHQLGHATADPFQHGQVGRPRHLGCRQHRLQGVHPGSHTLFQRLGDRDKDGLIQRLFATEVVTDQRLVDVRRLGDRPSAGTVVTGLGKHPGRGLEQGVAGVVTLTLAGVLGHKSLVIRLNN